MIHHFLYKTTNNTNGKHYVGVHSSKIDPMVSFDGYLGSGHTLKKAVKKYGKESFCREVMVMCDSAEYAYLLEERFVNDDFIKDKNNYNIVVGGKGGYIGSDFYNNEENKKKASERAKKQNKQFIIDHGEEAMVERMKYVSSRNTEESRKRAIEAYKKRYDDPEFVAKKKESAIKGWKKDNSDERRIQVSEQSKSYWANLSKEEYDEICAKRKKLYKGMMSAFNLSTGENVRVSKEEYRANDNLINHASHTARDAKLLLGL